MSECILCRLQNCVCGAQNGPQTIDPSQVFVNREAIEKFIGTGPYREQPRPMSPHLFTSDDEYWDLDAIVHAWWWGDSLRVILFAGHQGDSGSSARAIGKGAKELWEALKMYKGSK
jgi:hypothetical protein